MTLRPRDLSGTRLTVYGPTLGPALFLDRDGVLTEEVGYLHRIEDLRLHSGATEVVARANSLQVPVIVVTNQAGIGRGYFDWAAFDELHAEIQRRLGEGGARLDAVIACPYHAEGLPPYRHPDHPDRKPNPGMFRIAERELAVDLSSSWFLGDTVSDVEAGIAAGLRGIVHVLTGHGRRDRSKVMGMDLGDRVRFVDDLQAAAAVVPLLSGMLNPDVG